MAVKQRGLSFGELDYFKNIGELIEFLLVWNESYDEVNRNSNNYNSNKSRTSQARLATDSDWDTLFPIMD